MFGFISTVATTISTVVPFLPKSAETAEEVANYMDLPFAEEHFGNAKNYFNSAMNEISSKSTLAIVGDYMSTDLNDNKKVLDKIKEIPSDLGKLYESGCSFLSNIYSGLKELTTGTLVSARDIIMGNDIGGFDVTDSIYDDLLGLGGIDYSSYEVETSSDKETSLAGEEGSSELTDSIAGQLG